MTDPARLCEMVRAVAIRAHRLTKRTSSPDRNREEIDRLLGEIDELNRMIFDSGLHQTQLAAWAGNLRREVGSRIADDVVIDPGSIPYPLAPPVIAV
jgi:hypothetical protein